MTLLVFGSINLDFGLAVAHAPVAGETVLGAGLRISPGGKGANQAHAARLFGAPVCMVGRVGDDALAGPALALLHAAGVDLSGVVRDVAHATGVAAVMVLPSGDNAIVVGPGANEALRVDDLSADAAAQAQWLLLQMEVPVAQAMAAARRVRALGGRVMLNLAPARDIALVDPALIDWLIVNRSELATLCQALDIADSDPARGASAVAAAWRCTVVVTLGAAGAWACLPTAPPLHIPAPATEVRDTTGAGDTFCGVLAAALLQGQEPTQALRTASAAASLACTRPGAQAAQPTRADIDDAIARS